jgi:hypothetical protein
MVAIVIPRVETAECETFDNTVVGTLSRTDGGFSCLSCRPVEMIDDPCKVFGVNVRPYSVVCHRCGALIVDGVKKADGSGPLCIYDPPTV